MKDYTQRRLKQITYQMLIDITIWLERDKYPF